MKYSKLDKLILRSIIRILLILHNKLYKYISFFAVKFENGIHPKHRITGYHDFFINNISKFDLVLDIGCGNGMLTYDLSKKAKEVTGIDINKDNINYAIKKFSSKKITYILGDVNKVKFNKKYDVIILSNVLEHIKYRKTLLKKIRKITKKLLIRVPLIDRDWITLYKKEIGVNYKQDNSHYIEYTFKSFKKEIEKGKFKILKYQINFGEIWAVLI